VSGGSQFVAGFTIHEIQLVIIEIAAALASGFLQKFATYIGKIAAR